MVCFWEVWVDQGWRKVGGGGGAMAVKTAVPTAPRLLRSHGLLGPEGLACSSSVAVNLFILYSQLVRPQKQGLLTIRATTIVSYNFLAQPTTYFLLPPSQPTTCYDYCYHNDYPNVGFSCDHYHDFMGIFIPATRPCSCRYHYDHHSQHRSCRRKLVGGAAAAGDVDSTTITTSTALAHSSKRP